MRISQENMPLPLLRLIDPSIGLVNKHSALITQMRKWVIEQLIFSRMPQMIRVSSCCKGELRVK